MLISLEEQWRVLMLQSVWWDWSRAFVEHRLFEVFNNDPGENWNLMIWLESLARSAVDMRSAFR